MTDTATAIPPFALPQVLAKPFATSLIRNGLQVLAGAPASHGVIAASGEAQFVQVGAGVVVWALTQAWSWYVAHRNEHRVTVALSAPATVAAPQ